MDLPPVINFAQWVRDHADDLKPPVNNRQIWDGTSDFIVQVVGGPNARTDYHLEPYEEWFYQVKGAMHVNVMVDGRPRRIDVREGEMFLLPGGVPHSPQRPEAGSVGLVVERVRDEGTLERFQWYCPGCHTLVHDVELQVRDIVRDLPPVFAAFHGDVRARTCRACGTLHPGKSGTAP
ncbi:3-hydroxyanthranilate 3,4-dioxygenase [Streptomyces sp. NPDC014733]|uniref:3-hydroxyanthranilate 3,4-dioxygenase n=1 Tax=Streptomyces sp. NPDC014733 TaxID=3364885 RepID=UPI0036F5CCA2